MGIKYRTVKNRFPEMVTAISALDGRKVEIGVLQGGAQWLAAIHEYGCHITVTPKMRAYLHYQGLHLSPNTTTIKIPERSFLRAGHDAHAENLLKKAEILLKQVLDGKMSPQQWLDEGIGKPMATKIKDFLREISSPPNHPYTTDKKGSSNPLIDTGAMLNGITWRTK